MKYYAFSLCEKADYPIEAHRNQFFFRKNLLKNPIAIYRFRAFLATLYHNNTLPPWKIR